MAEPSGLLGSQHVKGVEPSELRAAQQLCAKGDYAAVDRYLADDEQLPKAPAARRAGERLAITPMGMFDLALAVCIITVLIIIFSQPEDHEARHFSFDAVLGASGKAINLEGFKRFVLTFTYLCSDFSNLLWSGTNLMPS